MASQLNIVGKLVTNLAGEVGLVTSFRREGHQYDRYWCYEVHIGANIIDIEENLIVESYEELKTINSFFPRRSLLLWYVA